MMGHAIPEVRRENLPRFWLRYDEASGRTWAVRPSVDLVVKFQQLPTEMRFEFDLLAAGRLPEATSAVGGENVLECGPIIVADGEEWLSLLRLHRSGLL